MFSLRRDPSSYNDTLFDLVIVGAGINGSACALEASMQGIKTLLIDKSDFGSKTSSGCFKIVHGGIRYLQHLNLKRLHESVSEQTSFRKMAPHLVRPLPFLVPTYNKFSKSKAFLACGVGVYEVLSYFKNRGIQSEDKLESFSVLSKEQCLKIAPGLNPQDITGAVVYYDAQMSHCERLTFAFARTAAREGADICNYLELISAERIEEESQFVLELKDCVSGFSVNVRARHVLNASGPWCSNVERIFGLESHPEQQQVYSKGIQVVLPKIISNYGVALESEHSDQTAIVSRGGRSYFMHPLMDRTLLGTTDSIFSGSPDSFSIERDEVEELVSSAASKYRDERLSVEKVIYAFGGLRPLAPGVDIESSENSHDSKVATHPEVRTYSQLRNVTSLIGVKYTTCRSLAESVVQRVSEQLGMPSFPSRTSDTQLVGSESLSETDFEKVSPQMRIYGNESSRVRALADDFAKSGENDFSFCLAMAEIEKVISDEMVVRLSDVLFRRTSLSQAGPPDERVISYACERMTQEHGWAAAKAEEEMKDFKDLFFSL